MATAIPRTRSPAYQMQFSQKYIRIGPISTFVHFDKNATYVKQPKMIPL